MDDFLGSREQRALGLISAGPGIDVLAVYISDLNSIIKIQRLCWTLRIAIAQIDACPLEPSSCGCREREGIFLLHDEILDARIDWQNLSCGGGHAF
jgi:hypothetical protein